MSGIYAFILGIVAVIGAWLFGKAKGTSETKTKISGQVIIEKQKAEKAEKEKDLALGTAGIINAQTAEQQSLNDFFNEFETKVAEAKKEENPSLAIDAAKILSERASQWANRNL